MDAVNDLSLMSVQEHRHAIEKYTQLLQNNPADIIALNNRGISLVSIGLNNKDTMLIREGSADLEKAAGIAIQCPILQQTLRWAQQLIRTARV